MGIDFTSALEQIFDALGQSATYIPVSGDSFILDVLPLQADNISSFDGSIIQSRATRFEILVSQVAAIKKKADKILFKSVTYTIQNAQYKDDLRLTWLVDTYPE